MAYNRIMGKFESGNIDSSLPNFELSQDDREKMKREKNMSDLEIDQFVARKTLDLQEGQLGKEGLKKEGEGSWAA
jgi:hypothetical protein